MNLSLNVRGHARRLANRAHTARKVLRAPALSWTSRWRFLFLNVARKRSGFELRLPRGTVQFPAPSLPVDRQTFLEIFSALQYACDYRDALVLDIGAHKGYFGAYALSYGARAVVSYEPESHNFQALCTAARSFVSTGHDWQVHRAAVAADSGEAELHVSQESWTHSLLPLPEGDRREVGSEQISTLAMDQILDALPREASRIVVKIDAEGAECWIIRGSNPPSWRRVDEVFIEVHDSAPCTAREIVAHLESGGLRIVGQQREVIHLSRDENGRT
jgi:FkbM family methyltransferase